LENELKVQDLESKQKHTELQHRATELEMQALRAQMNPHFIFNCLSSINRFILKNETEAASDYLTRFSRLIRMVLINSQKPTIPLEDEMEMLGLYLDMERLRFKNSFGYTITYDNITQSDSILIPPLLLQPFCENAIWHGLMHLANCTEGKERRAQLKILISKESGVLKCTISDNGIGRKKAAEIKSKSAEREKSLGLKITTDRLALLNKKEDIETYFEMQDLYDEDGNAAGTKVIIKIGCQETVAYLD
jgi:sensor histidine kinase YesM